MRNLILFIAALFVLSSCNPLGNDGTKKDSTSSVSTSDNAISEVREKPSATAVANYVKRVNDDLNEWYFRVQLYETKQRFVYRMVMEYETIKEEKDITFPNLNEEPKPEIRPGTREYDAVVGFIDNKGTFKNYLNVFVKDDNLQVKTLKYYAVSEK